jgi:hypothetical protein
MLVGVIAFIGLGLHGRKTRVIAAELEFVPLAIV